MSKNRTEFIRVVKNKNFTVMNNEFLKRDDMSWKAKGILAYILSLPDDWNINLNEVMKHATEGRDAFRSGWKELSEKGYVDRYPVKDEKTKRIMKWETKIYESVDLKTNEPDTENPDVEKPQVGNPDMEKPYAENPKLPSTNITNYLSKQSTDITNDNNNEKTGPEKREDEFRNNLKKVIQFHENHWGTINPTIMESMSYWIKDIGVDLVIEAMKRAAKHKGSYAYSETIMTRWVNNNIKTLDDVAADDVEFSNKNKKKYNSYSKPTRKDEKLPDWAKEGADKTVQDEVVPEDEQRSVQERLERLRRLRVEKLNE